MDTMQALTMILDSTRIDEGMPVLPGLEETLCNLDKSGVDVLMCSLLHWWQTGDSYCQLMVLPPYLFKKFEQCKEEIEEHLSRRAN